MTALHLRYLRILGFDEPPAGLDGLRLLVRRHLCRVPFENVSKLLLFAREGAGRPVPLPEFLDGIEQRDLGGTCYSCNPHFAGLLNAAGYRADLLCADMSAPNVHTCIRVNLPAAAYHVDVGYAAPFRDPIPLDALPCEIAEGAQRYVFDGSEMAFYSHGERKFSYFPHDPPRTLDFLTPVILDSFRPDAHFLNCLRLARFFEDHSVELFNRTVSIHRGAATTQFDLASLADLEHAVRTHFELPRCPVAEAVAVLERLTGKPFFTGPFPTAKSSRPCLKP